jgi:peptide/nickel transport system substrate-binding protein
MRSTVLASDEKEMFLRHRKSRGIVAIALVIAVLGAACGGDDGGGGTTAEGDGEVVKGGVWREDFTDFDFTGGLDPTSEYLSFAFALHGMLMHRNLVTYKHIAGAEGNIIVPDLAEEVPEPTNDGKTYTFTLKDGIKFGPPLSREIVCEDFAYTFARIDVENVVAQYGSYFDGTIEGMDGPHPPPAETPSGVKCLDDKTLEINLTVATGDILYRLAMPAAAAIPKEVASCFDEGKIGDYGRYQVSSGPYMIEGADQQDASSCDTLEPLPGYVPKQGLTLVRNPDYDPATDSPEVREANPDSFEFGVNTNEKDIFNKIEAGDLETTTEQPPPPLLRTYTTDPELEERLHQNSGDRTWYMTMNLTQPPFDDLAVRKAVNLVIDKDALRRAWGGEISGEIATHILPPDVTGGHPNSTEYDPYPSEGFQGDVEAAKEAMKESKYDTDQDGICDAPECKGFLHVAQNESPYTEMTPVIDANLNEIGLEPTTRELADAYTLISTVAKNVPFSSYPGWGKDYADAYTFVGFLFQGGDKILCEGNFNYSLVGVTQEVLDECGGSGSAADVPAVDDKIAECAAIPQGQERLDCMIELDKFLSEEVVPWVPYLWERNLNITGPTVTQWDFDQFSGETSYAHVAVDPEAQDG